MSTLTLDSHININPKAYCDLSEKLFNQFNGTVQTGPLRGARFENHFEWEQYNVCPKLIGCYEFELHDAIRKAIARRPDSIINAGCAEGYYACGLGRLLPDAEVHAMDINGKCLDQCARNGLLNGVLNMVLVEGKAGSRDLIRGKGHKLYFVDIEGYELSVLDPVECPDLLSGDIIVECHDFLVVENDQPVDLFITNKLRQRFETTHDINVIEPRIPRLSDFPFLRDLSVGQAMMAILDLRPVQTAWLACWAKQGECKWQT